MSLNKFHTSRLFSGLLTEIWDYLVASLLCVYSCVKGFVFLTYTGSRLQRVRLLRAPAYNEQIFFSEVNASDWY